MYIDTGLSAPKRFAKFEWQTQTFVTKKRKKMVCQAWLRQTIAVAVLVGLD